MVMKLAYESFTAGHLAIKRTVQKVLLEFFWPGIASDIQRFCQSCDICQRTIPKGKIIKAPLNKMPIIEDREDDEQSNLSNGTSQVCANSIFDMASEWSSGQVMNRLIVNLIMSGFSGKSKRIFNLSFASDPILVQGFAYNMVQYVMAGCQN